MTRPRAVQISALPKPEQAAAIARLREREQLEELDRVLRFFRGANDVTASRLGELLGVDGGTVAARAEALQVRLPPREDRLWCGHRSSAAMADENGVEVCGDCEREAALRRRGGW